MNTIGKQTNNRTAVETGLEQKTKQTTSTWHERKTEKYVHDISSANLF